MSPRVRLDNWRGIHLAREANKNVLVWRSRLQPLVFFAVLAGVAATLFGAYESTSLLHRLEEQKESGRNILVFSAADTNRPVSIDRRSCETLTNSSAVERAGIVEREGLFDFLQIGPDVPVLSASSSLFPLLNTNDAIVGSALVPDVQAGVPYRLGLSANILEAQVASKQAVGIDTNSAVVVALPPRVRSGSTCVVVLHDLTSVDRNLSQLSAQLQSSGGPLAATQMFNDTSDPIEDFINRSGRLLPSLLGLLGGVAAGILNRLRSGELAAYRLSGTSARSLYVLLLLEQALLAGLMVLSASLAIAALHPYFLSPASTLMSSFAAGCVWLIVAVLMTIDVPMRKPPDLAKDRG